MRCQRWKVMKIKTQMNYKTNKHPERKNLEFLQWSEGRREEGMDDCVVSSWKVQIKPRQWRDTVAPCHLSQIRSAETWNPNQGNLELWLTKSASARVCLLNWLSVFPVYFTRRAQLLWWIQESFCEQQKTYWGICTGKQWCVSGDSGELGGEESQEDKQTTQTVTRGQSIK